MGEMGNKRLLEQEKGAFSSVPEKKFLKTHHNSWLHKDMPKEPSGTRTPAAPGMAGVGFQRRKVCERHDVLDASKTAGP